MIELRGKYAEAKVFTDIVEPEAISQVIGLLNQPYAQGSKVRMMPDIHAGAGCTIGTTMTLTDKICPNLVGVDIGCGMYVIKLKEKDIDCQKLDEVIRQFVPAGMNIRENTHQMAENFDFSRMHCYHHFDENYMYRSLGSLGGGNHFIECGRDSQGNLYLVIHSGSRNLGVKVAKYYQDVAIRETKQRFDSSRTQNAQDLIQKLKAEGRAAEISDALKAIKVVMPPEDLMCCEGKSAQDYLHDMAIAQEFADLNRQIIAHEIISHMGWTVEEEFTTRHNYIDIEHSILRKGAVSAQKGEKLLIPMNMRDGSLLCIGKGNEDWNCSAPHGAGRLMSRAAAKKAFSMESYRDSMKGIFTTSVSESTLDECPMTYKPMDSILENVQDTVDVVEVIKPIYNFKA